ncbi:MAG: alcohol dehydrogenase catalytic domain-containing protein [Comamonadaceae bacterium]|nr:alcohol dehydrogenase catalytic domain-containing protein [Comamonadaceae bacterium]
MRAMLLAEPRQLLRPAEMPVPHPAAGQILLRVEACGVCRTDLHLIDGELPEPRTAASSPATRSSAGSSPSVASVRGFAAGQRVGVPWLGWTCGRMPTLRGRAREPLRRRRASPATRSTAATPNMRWPTRATAFPMPTAGDAAHAAPLLCAGLIGYRALSMAGRCAAHRHLRLRRRRPHRLPGGQLPGPRGLRLHPARRCRGTGASRANWARSGPATSDAGRRRVDWMPRCIFAPVGALVPHGAGARCDKGGTVVCAGIHMSDIPSFPYAHPVGRTLRALGGQPHARATARSSSPWRRRCRCAPRRERYRAGGGRTRRSTTCATAAFQGAAVLVMD